MGSIWSWGGYRLHTQGGLSVWRSWKGLLGLAHSIYMVFMAGAVGFICLDDTLGCV
jgi:hypothetical protein